MSDSQHVVNGDHHDETIHSKTGVPNEGSGYFLAGFWIRFWAYLLDLVVIGSLSRLLVTPIFKLLGLPVIEGSMFAPFSIITSIVFYGYFILMTRYFSQTIGKMVLGIKVIDLKGNKPSWSTIIFRELIGRFISTTIFILYVVVAFTNKKQGIHDLFADTTVVKENKQIVFIPAL
ncbi:RDD family protein [Rossellomorea aquimaris]|uniref:RDD family protein n=1 Tax=Rossellomorea aquimaris TaxID=189382 RepID=UPI0007D09B03|nr:RDD family protein [Rossellomorea aquimaris]